MNRISRELVQIAKQIEIANRVIKANSDSGIKRSYSFDRDNGVLTITVLKDGKYLKGIDDSQQRQKICDKIFSQELDKFLQYSYGRKDIYHAEENACYVDQWQFTLTRKFRNVLEIKVNLFGNDAKGYDIDDYEGEGTLGINKAKKIFAKCAQGFGYKK